MSSPNNESGKLKKIEIFFVLKVWLTAIRACSDFLCVTHAILNNRKLFGIAKIYHKFSKFPLANQNPVLLSGELTCFRTFERPVK